MRELHLFAGIGGGMLAGELLGHTPVCAVEIDPFCREILRTHWPKLPIHDDIRTFNASEWTDRIDVVAGGFPCQDISAAGKGEGLKGARSSLWFEMLRVVREVRPRYVFVENSPLLRTRGLGVVLRGLADLGFDAEWDVVSAADVGANHLRKRMWILAAHPDRRALRHESGRVGGTDRPGETLACVYGSPQRVADSDSERLTQQALHDLRQDGCRATESAGSGDVADAGGEGLQVPEREELRRARRWFERGTATECSWWSSEPDVGRVAHGVPSRVDRLRSLGNAQCPLQAVFAFERLASLMP